MPKDTPKQPEDKAAETTSKAPTTPKLVLFERSATSAQNTAKPHVEKLDEANKPPVKSANKPTLKEDSKVAPTSPNKSTDIKKVKDNKSVEKTAKTGSAVKEPLKQSAQTAAAEQPPEKTSEPEQPAKPKEAPRPNAKEEIVFLSLSELFPFKDHPFQVRNDEEMQAMVESVKDKGVTQPAIVRPREGGGYEVVSGHRRQKASELAGYTDMPCIVRNLTDEQAITQMVEDNTNQRENILPSERAKALHMQLEAIKRQGARNGNGQRSNEVVAERNKMTVKQVQRYIKLNELVPDLMKMVDAKAIAFTPAVEMAFISPKNQRYIAIAIEGQQSAPSLSQAQRMRELDQKKLLNPDVIDGIMLEQKKEADKVILSSQELSEYFGKEKTPREMKDTIIHLLDEWKNQQKDIPAPEKKNALEK